MAPSRLGPTYERASAADLCEAVSTTIILKTKKKIVREHDVEAEHRNHLNNRQRDDRLRPD